jgi:hypothetical protein
VTNQKELITQIDSFVGYYVDKYNFSVRYHNNQYCMFCRMREDIKTTDSNIINEIEEWARINRSKT